MSTSTSEHRADEGATLPAVQVRGECLFGARRDSLVWEEEEEEERDTVPNAQVLQTVSSSFPKRNKNAATVLNLNRLESENMSPSFLLNVPLLSPKCLPPSSHIGR